MPSALFGLGYMYLAGYGVVLDHRKAFKYFSQAAEQARLLLLSHPSSSQTDTVAVIIYR